MRDPARAARAAERPAQLGERRAGDRALHARSRDLSPRRPPRRACR
ncbi:MAG: hypothetical protein MZV49_09975 [Rhodopseudomonas palustris]|nr:hypothetical protein [Rhodopseudomonas palustris]